MFAAHSRVARTYTFEYPLRRLNVGARNGFVQDLRKILPLAEFIILIRASFDRHTKLGRWQRRPTAFLPLKQQRPAVPNSAPAGNSKPLYFDAFKGVLGSWLQIALKSGGDSTEMTNARTRVLAGAA